MTNKRRALGELGEDKAVFYLQKQGWQVLDRNWRCNDGEIDIVAYDPDAEALVVVEVKTRGGVGFGRPLETITVAKAHRLRRLAMLYTRETRRHAKVVRVDGVGVLWTPEGWEIEHAQRIDEW